MARSRSQKLLFLLFGITHRNYTHTHTHTHTRRERERETGAGAVLVSGTANGAVQNLGNNSDKSVPQCIYHIWVSAPVHIPYRGQCPSR